MSIASPPSSLTTVGVVTHPRRNCDEVFTAIVGWVRARGARLIALPEEAPAGVSLADQLPGEEFASTADLVIAAGGDGRSCGRARSRRRRVGMRAQRTSASGTDPQCRVAAPRRSAEISARMPTEWRLVRGILRLG